MTRNVDIQKSAGLLLITLSILVGNGFAACALDGKWDMDVTAVDNMDGSVTFTTCVLGSSGPRVCDLSHFSFAAIGDPANPGVQCGVVDPTRTTNAQCWGYGPDPSATACNAGEDVWKYDCSIPADGQSHCIDLTLWGVGIGCGDTIIKGGPGCIIFEEQSIPSCDPASLPCGPTPPPPCDPEAQAWTLTQGGWGAAPHYEALACEILANCPTVAADVGTVATCYGWDGIQNLAEWVTGDCGAGSGADGGFLPGGHNPGDNDGAQLIATILNIEGVACYGFDSVGGDAVSAIEPDWIILSTSETVGDVLDAAKAACGVGFAGILGEINESWDEGLDGGTVSPCQGL